MPKLNNVTESEIAGIFDKVDNLIFTMQDVASRVEKGYSDTIPEPLARVRALTALIGRAADLQLVIMMKVALDEQREQGGAPAKLSGIGHMNTPRLTGRWMD